MSLSSSFLIFYEFFAFSFWSGGSMFYERLRELCKQNHTTVSAMLAELGLSTGSTGNWKKGQLPKGDVLKQIADYLDTSIDYLVYGEYKCNLSNEEKHLLELYQITPDRAKYKVICDFETIVNSEIQKFSNL